MTESASPWLGRCNDCDFALFSTTLASAERFRDVKSDGRVFTLPSGYRCARCPSGHKPFKMKMVKGTYSPDHKCDARCMNAKGHDCTCSCGGMNHGRGHAITVTEHKETPQTVTERLVRRSIEREPDLYPSDPYHEPQHLGEVGKHITGEVTIERKRITHPAGEDSLLVIYTFRTGKGDKITWFCPGQHDPEWNEGDKRTIRAKVKRHEDHERFGKSTVVVYVEEV